MLLKNKLWVTVEKYKKGKKIELGQYSIPQTILFIFITLVLMTPSCGSQCCFRKSLSLSRENRCFLRLY